MPQVEGKAVLLNQGHWYRNASRNLDHGRVSWKTRIRVEDFIPGLYKGKRGKKQAWFRSGTNDNMAWLNAHCTLLTSGICYHLAQL